ncbi:MAG: CoA-binding protein [Planctomycetaceae bacterium]|nr:CoA-binding protein [Planctomycetaceae bacterium]
MVACRAATPTPSLPLVNTQADIDAFLAGAPHAVVGASTDRTKYGNKVLRCYQQTARPVHVVHPREREIEGVSCVASIADLPAGVHGLSIITPPAVTEQVVQAALAKGIRHLWMQPGAESAKAIELARAAGLNVIAGGPCLLVVLRFRE